MEDLFQTLPKILRAAGNSTEVLEAASIAVWKHIVGDGLRWNAVPLRLFKTTLVVAVPDAGWKKQLEPMSAQLLFRINALLGQSVVSFIEYRVDAAKVAAERKIIGDARPAKVETLDEAMKITEGVVRSAAAGIQDESLRTHFLLAAGSCLSRVEDGT